MNEFSEECLITFLRNQEQLFPEPVAETVEEAEAFLEDCMAVVVDTLEEVKEYFEENGMDVDEMSMNELEEASEIFALPNGQYLIVEAKSQKRPGSFFVRKDCLFFKYFG